MLSMILQWVHPALAADGDRALPQEQKPGSNRSSRPDAKKVDKEIAMVDRLGLHARPAALFARSANRFCADVWVERDSTEVNGKSILGLNMLGANQGSKLRICIEGPDPYEEMREIERLIQSWFDEDKRRGNSLACLAITSIWESSGMTAPPATEAAPKAGNPSTLASFVKANNNRDTGSVTACFSKDAVVYDDGQIMRGTDEIRQWIAELFRKFQCVVAPTNVRELTNGAILTATITGNFPRASVSLDYHCRTLGDKIDVMIIQPTPVAK